MWAVCDLAMVLLNTKSTTFELKEFIAEARIPTMYFKRHEDPMFVNTRHYLPPEMYNAPNAKKNVCIISNASTNTNNTNSNSTNMNAATTTTNSSAPANDKNAPVTNTAGGRKLRGRKLEITGTNETDVQVRQRI